MAEKNGPPGTVATLERITGQLRAGSAALPLHRVISRSIAVSSGKGGVGKTITACNLALYYARKGLRVGLVDLDPLSDVASLLDLQDSEQAFAQSGSEGASGGGAFSRHVLPAFRGLEILFPFQKLTTTEMGRMVATLYGEHLGEVERRYDLLIFDMPAGMGYEDNLAFLPLMRLLVLVTNPEPTSHASAGAYAKEVLRLFPGTTIRLWHNRYNGRLRAGFHPRDVAGNYNRYVDASARLTPPEIELLQDFAFVPEDPTLDLLQGEPLPALHVLKCMRDGLDYALGRLLSQAIKGLHLPPRIREVVAGYVHRNPVIAGPQRYVESLAEYLRSALSPVGAPTPSREAAEELFSAELRAALEGFLRRVKQSGLRKEMLRMQEMLVEQVRRIEEARGPFAGRTAPERDAAFDRELGRLLVILNRAARGSVLMRNQGVLLLFHFALHKLFQSRTLVGVIRGLIPRRMGHRGKRVRDRFRQIRALVEKDQASRDRYLKALRALHGLVVRQLAAVARALDLGGLLILDGQSRVDGRPYLKLLAAFLHETLYSGLSVIVGFDYRSAAAAFQDGAERLLAALPPRG